MAANQVVHLCREGPVLLGDCKGCVRGRRFGLPRLCLAGGRAVAGAHGRRLGAVLGSWRHPWFALDAALGESGFIYTQTTKSRAKQLNRGMTHQNTKHSAPFKKKLVILAKAAFFCHLFFWPATSEQAKKGLNAYYYFSNCLGNVVVY